jgi:hypothetical protein
MKIKLFLISLFLTVLIAGSGQAQYKCFYGNLHAHTSFSDGESTPDTAFAYARDVAGIDVQALTDHNNGGYDYNPALYQIVKHTADSFTVAGVFLALAGQEIGKSTGFGHIASYDTPELSPFFNNASDLLSCYEWLLDSDRPAMFCHPMLFQTDDFNYFYYYPEYLKSMDLLEVINQNGNFEDKYLMALQQGWQVGAAANQDNHDRNWGAAANSLGQIPLTGIWADTLTKASVLDALQSRRTFATLVRPAGDFMELSIKAGNHWQGDYFITSSTQLEFEVSAKASINSFAKLLVYSDGLLSDSLKPQNKDTVWQFTKPLGPGKHYFFVKAIQTDNDMSWTSPVFVDVIEEAAKTKVVTWPTPVRASAQVVYQPLENADRIKAEIYDLMGNLIWQSNGITPSQTLIWNGCYTSGKLVPNGLYMIRIEQRSPAASNVAIGRTVVSR